MRAYVPTPEHDFLALAEVHDIMDKHVPLKEGNSYFCQSCQMPLNYSGKIDAPKGNSYMRNYTAFDNISNICINDYEYMNRVLAYYMQVQSFPAISKAIETMFKLGELNKITDTLCKYFMPQHRAVSEDYSRVALWIAMKTGGTSDLQRWASLSAGSAFDYACIVDRQPADVTRNAACRRGDLALNYAIDIDKGYHPATFAKVLQSRPDSFTYMKNFVASPGVKEAVYNCHVKRGPLNKVSEWTKICGGNDETRELVMSSNDPKLIIHYAIADHGKPDDKLRAYVIANGESCDCVKYALHADCAPRNDTRTAACKHPDCAVDYAVSVDKAPCDETRLAATKSVKTAMTYASNVDREYSEQTMIAVLGDPEMAHTYSQRFSMKKDELERAVSVRSSLAVAYAWSHGPSDITRAAACRNSQTALTYAMQIDKVPRDDTREAASWHKISKDEYDEFEYRYKAKLAADKLAAKEEQ